MESPPACHFSNVSLSRSESSLQCQSNNLDEMEECSADPDAFLGFHVPSMAKNGNRRPSYDSQEQQEAPKKMSLRLVLDLKVSADNVTRESDGFRPAQDPIFSGLFTQETQEDAKTSSGLLTGIAKQLRRKNQVFKGVRSRAADKKQQRSFSPPTTNFTHMDSVWNARKQKLADRHEENQHQEGEVEEEEGAHSALIPTFSEYSEDVAPVFFQTVYASSVSSLGDESFHKEDTDRLASGEKVVRSGIPENSDRETDYEDGMECTQQLLEEDTYTDEPCNDKGRNDEETEVYPSSENESLPYKANSVFQEDVNYEKNSSEQKDVASVSYSRQTSVVVPTLGRTNDQRIGEDEVTSREGSQAIQQNCMTPRVNPSRVGHSVFNINDESIIIVDSKRNVEQISKTSQNDNNQDECVPTQPSKFRTEDEPVVEPSSPVKQNVKKNGENVARKHVIGTDSHTKAIRSLEFSLSIPKSQEDEPLFSASLSSNGTPTAKRLEAFTGRNRPSPFETSISPVCLPSSTLTQLSVDAFTVPEAASDNQVSPKRKTVSSSQSELPSVKKKPKTMFQVTDSPCQTNVTPIAKKRNSGVFSPDNNASASKSNESTPQTPRCPVRRNSRSAQLTPSLTPTVRTRIRTLTPVPSQRTYVSRSRSLFKYKFEFCLTGFVKTGERNLKELIEGHGGKIPERYQDVLYKTNPKAVVIAMPVSWRKRKFMQAVACGIPVVHTDWIKGCIEAGHVISFDGYQVPIGYSVTTRTFKCFSPKELHIFEGFSFGIASDVEQLSKCEAKDKAKLMVFILKACGAEAVYENLSTKDSIDVDVVLCDEYTPTCRHYKKMRHIPVKDFQWVTECMILQQLLDPEEPDFKPLRVKSQDVFAASAGIGDSDNTTLKLYKGELVMADIAGSVADHYLLFNVCEILSIHVSGHKDESSQSKRKDCKESRVMLRVGILKREPYNPELSKPFVKVLDISSFQVKRRVVAISKKDYSQLKYKDESIFYLEDESSMSNTSG